MIFKNIGVVAKDQVLSQQTLQIKGGQFTSIKHSKEHDEGTDYQGCLLVPGFIDLH